MNGGSTARIRGDSSGDRMLAVLGLFTIARPHWSVEDAAARLGVSATTSYRYFKRLTRAGLISPVAGAGYTLGPAIIEMDRQIQICDPMLRAARTVMSDLVQQASEGSTALLCRLYHDRVMCVHQVMGRGPQAPVSYERGRLMPLFRGATAKVILAHLPARTLKSLFAQHRAAIAEAGLGADWLAFRAALARLRRVGGAVTHSDLDPGRVGLAAPIFDRERAVLGSLSVVLPAVRAEEAAVARLLALTIAGARAIERAMNADALAPAARPARLKVVP